MMADFAFEAQSNEGKSSSEAIYEGSIIRFQPIMVTTMEVLMETLQIALGLVLAAEFTPVLWLQGLSISEIPRKPRPCVGNSLLFDARGPCLHSASRDSKMRLPIHSGSSTISQIVTLSFNRKSSTLSVTLSSRFVGGSLKIIRSKNFDFYEKNF